MRRTSCLLLACLMGSFLAAPEAGAAGTVPKRSDIPDAFKWRLSDITPDTAAWEKEAASVEAELPALAACAGTLSRSPETLLACLRLKDRISVAMGRLFVYAQMKSHEDTADSAAQALADRSTALSVRVETAGSFLLPEMLALPEATLRSWSERKDFADYRFFIRDLIRQKAHILSAPEEALLARMGEIAQIPENTFSLLTNADLKFPEIEDERGHRVELSEERYQRFIRSPKRSVREAAFRALYDTYGTIRNTCGATFNGMLKVSAFSASVRKYPSALAAALDGNDIPVKVYDNVVETVEANLKPLHRYVALRKRILGLPDLHMYDLYVPLTEDPMGEIPWEQGRETVLESLRPLGETYLAEARAGLDSGWVDVYENQGKRKGAYSWGSYGTHPYILLNYDGRINDVFTLAHELGHSMHSFYSHRSQPYPTADYAIFVAEVASTTNEALLLDHLLKTRRDRRERIFLLNHFLEEVRTTLYRQAMFASFERTVHERSEAGEALTPEDLSDLWTKLNRRYYGPQIEVDPGIALEWARIPHFYTPFYVYQYCTGFAAAQALSRGILEGKPGARERTLTLLSRGSSDTPIALLKEAGVDMTTPEPIEETIRLFERALDEMEELLDRGDR